MVADPQRLRPGELCRLLNSTALGEVISDRTLHRHRTRAGMRIGDGQHVDLLRYTAWLVQVRHEPKPETDGDPYAKMKERARARNAALALAGRDIGDLPDVQNPDRKAQATTDFRFFCESYFPLTFHLAWSPDHLKVINKIEQAVIHGGLFAMAMPRGSGKTTICECACIWAVLYGHREFVALVGSDEGHAMDMLDSIKMELDANDQLLSDFVAPFIRVLGGRIDIGAFEHRPITAVDGDFNDDGTYDCLDIDALVAEIAAATNGLAFDMTGDGMVDLADRDAWLAEAGGINLGPGKVYLLGDATLDGIVDGLDFIEWNDNKFTSIAEWCAGDFNADGAVDGQDFVLWNRNKFVSSDGTSQIVLPDPHKIDDTRHMNVNNDTIVDASSVSPRLVPLAAKRVDSVFATSRRGEDQQDERPRDDSFENLDDALSINSILRMRLAKSEGIKERAAQNVLPRASSCNEREANSNEDGISVSVVVTFVPFCWT